MAGTGSEAVNETAAARRSLPLPSPLLLIALAALACVTLLFLPLTLPIGPMYWDLFVYVDGAQRVLSGQVPSVDFFAPVGPLAYWLAAAGTWAFPNAQPLLLVQWSLLALTAPMMALVLREVDRRSRPVALALLLPFLAFQLMPMNVEQYSTFPSTDGFGIYNRHAVNLLTVLATALVFSRSQAVLLVTIAASCLALFLLKITGFVSGGLLCLFAFAAGRVHLRTAVAALAIFLAAIGLLQLASGLPAAYVGDILALVGLNEGSLLPRFLLAASLHFGVFGSGCLLVLALLVLDRSSLRDGLKALAARPSAAGVHALLDRPALWLGTGLAAGVFFETQNTGGQAFTFLWPILLLILLDAARLGSRSTILVFALVAATAMPPLVNTLHRFARVMVGQIQYLPLEHRHLGTLGAVSQRDEALRRAHDALDVYAGHPDTYADFSRRKILPGWSLYSDLDFQIGWLMAADEAVEAVLAYERDNGVRFETVMVLNFANPFPALLGREATRHIAIGADPFRAVPPMNEETAAAVAATDLILYPTCPITTANDELHAIYAPAMTAHERVVLSRCWVGYMLPQRAG